MHSIFRYCPLVLSSQMMKCWRNMKTWCQLRLILLQKQRLEFFLKCFPPLFDSSTCANFFNIETLWIYITILLFPKFSFLYRLYQTLYLKWMWKKYFWSLPRRGFKRLSRLNVTLMELKLRRWVNPRAVIFKKPKKSNYLSIFRHWYLMLTLAT